MSIPAWSEEGYPPLSETDALPAGAPYYIPAWGQKGCPPLPNSLRTAWGVEDLPAWVAEDLNLPETTKYSSLSADVWSECGLVELPVRVRRFLINMVAARVSSISGMRVLADPWPRSLDPAALPWPNRTRNCLKNSGLLTDTPRLSIVTYGELLSIRAMGVTSVLEFACVAEVAIHAGEQTVLTSFETGSDYAEVLLEAIDAPWSTQVSHQDPRFADLLPARDRTVFERLDQITVEPQDPPLAEIALAREIVKVKARLSELAGPTLEAALSGFVECSTRLRGRKLQALVSRLGCGGEPPATLEEAASLIGVTRERLRQIQKRFTDHLPHHPIFMPQLDTAIALVREAAPVTVDGASELLLNKRVTDKPFHPESLLAAADLCRRPRPFEIDFSAGAPRVVLEHRKDLERTCLSVACKQAGASGATNIQEVLAEVMSKTPSDIEEKDLRRFLQDCSGIEFLSGDWFWHMDGVPDRNRLRNVTRKMLSVTSPIHVGELREGVQRHYRIRGTRGHARWPLLTPPRAVLEAFYRAHPEFAVDSAGRVSPVMQLDYRAELNPTERVLLDVLRSSPACLLDYGSFGRACADAGMNPNTFTQYLSSSPVIAHLGPDLWSLRGIRVDAASVEVVRQANAARPRERRIMDHGWTGSGDLWFAARLPELQSGLVLGVPSAIRRFVAGREFATTDESGVPAGTVRVNAEGASYGYGGFLARCGADEDDILLVTFRLTEGTATLRLIGDEELEDLSPGN